MKEGKLHQKIRDKHFSKQVEEGLLAEIEELKKSRPMYMYGDEEPPKDPLVAVTELNKRFRLWFNEVFGDELA